MRARRTIRTWKALVSATIGAEHLEQSHWAIVYVRNGSSARAEFVLDFTQFVSSDVPVLGSDEPTRYA